MIDSGSNCEVNEMMDIPHLPLYPMSSTALFNLRIDMEATATSLCKHAIGNSEMSASIETCPAMAGVKDAFCRVMQKLDRIEAKIDLLPAKSLN
jgi:hypothetical protein